MPQQLDGATRGLQKEKVESQLPISVSLLPESSPVIDFHIKQAVALTLFPDIAQSVIDCSGQPDTTDASSITRS